ncbi:MAG: DNA alkylation repair protein [Pseudobutyrivibrio sp.]|nr:DNA alkylation repair protein [Pseudobutyrivibrio sp.]
MTEILQFLFDNQDKTYQSFQQKLCPSVEPERIIGVRIPILRHYAKILLKENKAEDFLKDLPHKYYDEYMLHVILVSQEKDFEKAIAQVEAVLPYIDNWAACDTLSPKAFKKNPMALLEYIHRWLESDGEYELRFGIKMLMDHFLDEKFDEAYLEMVAAVESDAFYVKMMVAWYFATALAKQYDSALVYIKEGRLERWTSNKSIQKAVESYRVTEDHKAYLKTLRR